MKLLELVAVPPLVVTLTFPVFALLGTVALIFVAEVTLKVAFKPANLTAVAPLKFVPVIVTFVPTLPLAGEKLLIQASRSLRSPPAQIPPAPKQRSSTPTRSTRAGSHRHTHQPVPPFPFSPR